MEPLAHLARSETIHVQSCLLLQWLDCARAGQPERESCSRSLVGFCVLKKCSFTLYFIFYLFQTNLETSSIWLNHPSSLSNTCNFTIQIEANNSVCTRWYTDDYTELLYVSGVLTDTLCLITWTHDTVVSNTRSYKLGCLWESTYRKIHRGRKWTLHDYHT